MRLIQNITKYKIPKNFTKISEVRRGNVTISEIYKKIIKINY